MIPIKVDISDPIDRFNLTQQQANDLANAVVSRLATSFAAHMEAGAKKKLRQTRQAFIDGIKISMLGGGKAQVELVGFLPNAVNTGLSPFDMKIGFGRSSKVKKKKDGGWYITIPFRLATPKAVATSQIFSGRMPVSVHNVAKRLRVGRGLPASSLPEGHRDRRFSKPIDDGRFGDPYQHKAPIYQGITKNVEKGQETYSTFRRVSDNSEGNSWIHTGIEARNIHLDAISQMDVGSEVKMVIDNFLDTI